ncbi:deoxyribodipyrimidine photo-lyase [Corynebacterium qintianiae]|uniref:Deoxyribodipyrimidine photo-lyase n=1 Tax=Corynebacterium qintianiae TaxID=2709392 RepID=A0A7T0PF38_9CORY|nr:deoxyribodipyrimidine photo-lyase [Corynebacterium qintianiae]QPK83896.1 deoxyribodipyrimidine photo-lyase [Corynebacterium qintianiae]
MTATPTTLVWFRDDLRLADNAALSWAAERGPVVGLFVHETVGRPLGGAAAWWLRRSLENFRASFPAPLIELSGDPRDIVPRLARELGAEVTWNRRYHRNEVDAPIKEATGAVSHPGYLLTEPWEVRTSAGRPYRVFTPFHKAVQSSLLDAPPTPLPAPDIIPAEVEPVTADRPPEPTWTATLAAHNTPGEQAAHTQLDRFLGALADEGTYDNDALDGVTSGLSAHLRFGEISPDYVWHRAAAAGTWAFLRQLVWRDFAWHRFYHLPDMATRNVRAQFDRFPWEWTPGDVPGDLAAWQSGRTGVPLVDAGMRELWATGRMHNRVRMVAGSWLTKNLGIHWRHGEEWFWDTLVDADAASNAFNWQWVAGSGDDAAPYFRVFNPLTQAEKFDPRGNYVRRWVPEANTPLYPEPMVDIKESRRTALAAYDGIRTG